MARGVRMWLMASGLMVAGSVAAHVAGDVVGASPDGDHGEAARSGGHLLAGAAPLLAGVLVVLVAATVFGLVAMRFRPSTGHALSWIAWMLPIAGFLVQEALERVTVVELPGFTGAHDPTALTGLLGQAPFALALVWLARRLVGAVRRFATRFERRTPPRRRRRMSTTWPAQPAALPRLACLALGYPQRGPPIASS